MKTIFIIAASLSLMPSVVLADAEPVPDSQGESAASTSDDARHERYRRRYELMTVREAKRRNAIPVMPVAPVAPVVSVAPVVPVAVCDATEEVSVKVESLMYDEAASNGVLTIEVVSGAFKDVNRHIRSKIGKLVRTDAPGGDAPKVPPDARLKIESITIDEDDVCTIKFKIRGRKEGEL